MRLNTALLKQLKSDSDVLPGNIYPAKGGGRKPGTDFWLVVATSDSGAHVLGFNANGEPVSTSSYGKHALRERPVIGRIDISGLELK